MPLALPDLLSDANCTGYRTKVCRSDAGSHKHALSPDYNLKKKKKKQTRNFRSTTPKMAEISVAAFLLALHLHEI